MSYFKEQIINIGHLRVGQKRKVTFQSLPNIPEVISITSGCSCSSPLFSPGIGKLEVDYKAKSISRNVTGAQSISVPITVYFKDLSKEVLYIKGTKSK